jgi:hypothetical protein
VAVEPEGRGRFGPLTVILGVIVPVVVPQSGPRIVSGELGLGLDFEASSGRAPSSMCARLGWRVRADGTSRL